ncbi:MAG: 2OG-Fe(II) oxygenase [Wenzhouxiangellaceae bacterium]
MNQGKSDFIGVYDDALDAAFCERLISRFDGDNRVTQGRTGHGVDLSKKDSMDLTISDHEDWRDEISQLQQSLFPHLCDYMIAHRYLLIGALSPTVMDPDSGKPTVLNDSNFERLGIPLVPQLVDYLYYCGRLNLQRYRAGSGNYNHWHSEIYPQQGSVEPLHRVLLFQYYLNDVSAGGHTHFHYQQRTIAPKRGRLIIAPAGFTHTHRGEVPESNDKYVVTSWVLFKPAEVVYSER